MSDPADERRLVHDAIVEHLTKHPAAADTAEGIRSWWLGPAQREEDITVVEHALQDLVDSGMMRRRTLPDGGVLYFAARAGGR